MTYSPSPARYGNPLYRRSGRSGLMLPAISLGLWNNFGHDVPAERSRSDPVHRLRPRHHAFRPRQQLRPAPWNIGSVFRVGLSNPTFAPYRDELIVSTKAGWEMWDGPYGDWGSRKYLLASLDQRLKRMGLDYVDIFYSHRFDPTRRWRRRWARSTRPCDKARRFMSASPATTQRADRRSRSDPAAARHAGRHPPAAPFDVRPLDRARPAARPS